jgi:hypothetical protein
MPKSAPKPELSDLYYQDFHAWTQTQARLLSDRRFDELDLANLIDEISNVGAAEKTQIETHLEGLVANLLKWKYQPGARSHFWRDTIDEQRGGIARIVEMSPSLRSHPLDVFEDCFAAGRQRAARETGIDPILFPEFSPFTLEEALEDSFWP